MPTQTLELDDLARTRDAHVAALNANDADGWVACFAPDAVQMPPNDPANVGTANIHAWSAGMLSAFNAEFALDVDETQLAGDNSMHPLLSLSRAGAD
jgi:ketosteroid isomerase-like protein